MSPLFCTPPEALLPQLPEPVPCHTLQGSHHLCPTHLLSLNLSTVTAPSPVPLRPADLLAAPQHVSTTALAVPGAWSTLPRLQAEWLVLFKCRLSAGPFQPLH